MFDKGKYLLLPITLFLLGTSVSVHAGLYDWGLKGVSDTTRVEKVLQFTDNPPYSNSEIGYYADPWSFGGDWIVYTVAGTNYHTLYKVRSNGTEPIQLTGNVTDDTNASFASDGRIYFDRKDHIDWKNQIWVIESDGTKKNLSAVHGGYCERYVRPSPDARLIAYKDCFSNELKVALSDGTFPEPVSGTESIEEPHHDWSPDSQWLVYKGIDSPSEWVYKVKSDGSSRTAWTEPPLPSFVPFSHRSPAWSPDGKEIAFIARSTFDLHYYYTLRIISADDNSAPQKYLDSATDSTPGWQNINGPLSWSPDGKWIAYWKTYTSGGTYRAIFIAPSDGSSEPIQLTTGYNDFKSFWSPDGLYILFYDYSSLSRDENGHKDLLMLKLKGSYGKFPWPLFLPAFISGDG